MENKHLDGHKIHQNMGFYGKIKELHGQDFIRNHRIGIAVPLSYSANP